MIINHNIAALNTFNQLTANSTKMNSSLAKLSSGMRINSAADDAAGLAISQKMQGQINGLDQASRNAQDSISLVQTAEGALNESQSILQRMRELAVQASNDTNTSSDRTAMQTELNQLTQEIDRIGNTTQFNTKNLLDGGAAVAATVTGTGVTVNGGTADTKVGAAALLTAWAQATAATSSATTATFIDSTAIMAADSTITLNGVSFAFGATDTVQNVLDTINNAGIGAKASYAGNTISFASTGIGSKASLAISGVANSFAGTGTVLAGKDATATITDSPAYTADGNTITIQAGSAKGLSFNVSGASGNATITVTANGGLSMQIGANQNQSMYVSIGDMRSAALGVNNIDLSSTMNAGKAIATIDSAITTVSTERSKLGAYQNRLEHTINNLTTSSQNLTSAQSRIQDVDMAKEMMNYTKSSIINQAATAMLAQANQMPQSVLKLLQ
jgi:flagellin